ncbi:MAG: hypothetical protein AB7I52_08905 [Rhizobiaceae bacterium]
MGWKSIAAALIFAGGIATSASADEAFCRNYAWDATQTAATASRIGCGFDGARWGTDHNLHFNDCMETAASAPNGESGRVMMNRLVNRHSDVAKCEANKVGVAAPWNSKNPFTGSGTNATQDGFCRAYAYVADLQGRGTPSQCGYTGGRWQASFDQHRQACMDWAADAGKIASSEIDTRTDETIKCLMKIRDGANNPPPVVDEPDPQPEPEPEQPDGTLKVVKQVTGYHDIEGEDACYFKVGDTATFIEEAGDENPNWIKVEGTSGACNGQEVWVYNDGKMR